MLRFTKALLLVASTLPPSLFVNGNGVLRPTIHNKPEIRNAVIRGLLVPRQSLCDPGFVGCEAIGCCPIGWPCCADGNCCDPTTYCVLASNNIIGCCPIGELCSGPAGDPTTINGPPPPTPTINPPPPPPPTPTINSPPPPPPTFSSVPPSTPTINSPPPPITQSTVNSAPVPTFVSSTPSASSGGGLPLSSAAGQAQLYRPLLLMLVGILLAAIY